MDSATDPTTTQPTAQPRGTRRRAPHPRWRRAIVAALGLSAAALLLAACFGGDDGEVAIASQQPEGPEEQPTGSEGDTDGSTGQETTEQQSDQNDEEALLDIVTNADGAAANPDNRTGAPPTFPSIFCAPQAGAINFVTLDSVTFQGRERSAMACMDGGDLSRVTVKGPDGQPKDRFWAEGLFELDFTILDQSGSYEVTAAQRQGPAITGTFTLEPLRHLAISPIATDDGWRLALAGYGRETSVRIAVYGHAGDGMPSTALSYVGELGQIDLEADGTTVVELTADRDLLCFYVDARDEDRFPNYDPGCLDNRIAVPYQPGDSPLARSLTAALGNPRLQAIGPVVAAIDDQRAAAVVTTVDASTGDPTGAALVEGQLDGSVDNGFVSARLIAADENRDFTAAFGAMCQTAADTYVVIGNPCLRFIELPPDITFVNFELIKLDVTSLLEITEQAAITDCLPYDPAKLSVIDEGESGWLLTDGRSRMAVLDNERDAAVALAVARYHDRHCFVGRDNKREDRDGYLADFWLGGKPGGPALASEDCIPYDPAKLELVDLGADGWRLTDGRSAILVLDSKLDAQKAMNTAAGFSSHCFAGRDNKRSNRARYIFEYWK